MVDRWVGGCFWLWVWVSGFGLGIGGGKMGGRGQGGFFGVSYVFCFFAVLFFGMVLCLVGGY